MKENSINSAFSRFSDVIKHRNNREVVLFGAGTISPKTARKIDKYAFIVDNNPNLWNCEQDGKDVLKPDVIKNNSSKYFLIICTTSFIEVSEQLIDYGYIPDKDFIVSPILNDLRVISDLEHHSTKLLFTSGVPENDNKKYGGGIYELILKGHSWEYRKVYSGICYGLIEYNDNYIIVDDNRGIVELDKNYNILRTKKLAKATRGHGIGYSHKYNKFYIVASYMDEVLVFDKDFNQIDNIKLSNKFEREGSPAHHMNDLCVVGDSLYVTMFSYTGNWKKDVFDGVVLEIDLTTNLENGVVVSDLWMPHNICFLDGSITVLDSLRGELKTNNARAIGKFPAFTRGLDFDGIYYYVGQSRNRNYSKNLGLSLNISIDTAIIIFDPITKASRTIHFPQKLSEIHSILVIED
jgi:hypothetical protein